MIAPVADRAELKWRCRRGMLELDILLNTYLDKHYNALSAEQRAVFVEILDYPDQVLFDLLLGNMQSSNAEVNKLVIDIQGMNQASLDNNH